MKSHYSRRHFIEKFALFTGAAASRPPLPSFARNNIAP